MKKLGVAVAVFLGGTTVAVASTLGVPWFVDGAPEANFIPGVNRGVTGIVYLKNNVGVALDCSIEYFSQDGVPLGPANNAMIADTNNSFTIPPYAAVAFRPYRDDPFAVAGGQESDLARTIPNRPTVGVNSVLAAPGATNDGKDNGSLTISWTGSPSDLTGTFVYYQTFIPPSGDSRFPTTMSYGHLLPGGV